MKVEVLLIGEKEVNGVRISRNTLFRSASRISEYVLYASKSYVWSHESLWATLKEVRVPLSDHHACFRSVVDVAYSASDLDVLLMLGREITAAIPTWACRVTAVLTETKSFDALLLQLADKIDESIEFRDRVLEQCDVNEWNYDVGLQGRLWFINGNVRILSPLGRSIMYDSELQELKGRIDVFSCGSSLSEVEAALTSEIARWITQDLSSQMRRSSVTICVVVPVAFAFVLKKLPSLLLKECLLYHLVHYPLHNSKTNDDVQLMGIRPLFEPTTKWPDADFERLSDSEKNTLLASEEELLQEVTEEYLAAEVNDREIRVPLEHIPTYLFQLLVKDQIHFAKLVALNENENKSPTEKKLGAKMCFAMSRWKKFLSVNYLKSSMGMSNNVYCMQKLLSSTIDDAKSNVKALVGDLPTERNIAQLRECAMHPFPLAYRPSEVNIHQGTSAIKSDRTHVFQQFDQLMMNDDTSDSTSTLDSRIQESYPSSSEREALEELELAFFSELHLTAESGSEVVDEDAAKQVIQNKLFDHTLNIFSKDT